jgi:hypothetical protein
MSRVRTLLAVVRTPATPKVVPQGSPGISVSHGPPVRHPKLPRAKCRLSSEHSARSIGQVIQDGGPPCQDQSVSLVGVEVTAGSGEQRSRGTPRLRAATSLLREELGIAPSSPVQSIHRRLLGSADS